jgi:hypothetical protein
MMTESKKLMLKKLDDLVRNKRRAKRRGDPNFYKISEEHKALKLKIAATQKESE